MNKPMDNKELENALPDLIKQLNVFDSKDFREYEEKIDKVASKALDGLQAIIDDGTLQLDPEQMVKAVAAISKAKSDIIDSKRRLLETVVRGQVMLKALEPPKEEKSDNALLEYLKANNLDQSLANSSNNSIFGEVEKQQ